MEEAEDRKMSEVVEGVSVVPNSRRTLKAQLGGPSTTCGQNLPGKTGEVETEIVGREGGTATHRNRHFADGL